jgi:hypothetical protein
MKHAGAELYSPLWQRGVRGDFIKKLFVKSPFIPLCQRGRLEKGKIIYNKEYRRNS